MKKKKSGKTGIKAAAASAAALGVLISSLFSSPAELVKDRELPPDPPALVEVMAEAEPNGDGGDSTETAGEEKKRGAYLKKLISRLPIACRALVCVPLWCIGTVLTDAFSAFFGNVLVPAAYVLIRYILIAFLVLAGILAAVKTVAPEVPLRKVFNRRNIIAVILGTAVLGLGGSLVRMLYPKGTELYETLESIVILAAFACASVRTVMLRKKYIKAKQA